jgi:hypothetical protein
MCRISLQNRPDATVLNVCMQPRVQWRNFIVIKYTSIKFIVLNYSLNPLKPIIYIYIYTACFNTLKLCILLAESICVFPQTALTGWAL